MVGWRAEEANRSSARHRHQDCSQYIATAENSGLKPGDPLDDEVFAMVETSPSGRREPRVRNDRHEGLLLRGGAGLRNVELWSSTDCRSS